MSELERKQIVRWTELGCTLLNVAHEDQIKFEEGFKQVQKDVRKHWNEPDNKNSIELINGPERRRDAFVGIAYRNISTSQRNILIENCAGFAMEHAKTDRAIVIGTDIDARQYPYSIIASVGKQGNLIAES